jgi:hypothetical protein
MSALEFLQGDRRGRPASQRPADLLVPVAGVVAIAIVMGGLLCLIGAPSNGHDRLMVATNQIAAMENSFQHSRGATPYSAGAICPSRDVGADLARQRLQQAAAAAGVPLTDVSVVRGSSNEATGLTDFTVSFGAEAQYDALLHFLETLGDSQPEVFVDTADLTPNTSVATLKLTGRALCWTVARR